MSFENLLKMPAFSAPQHDKDRLLLDGLNDLSRHHQKHCEPFRNVIDALWNGQATADQIESLPFLPVSIFKTQRLSSVSSDDIRLTLTSSGTTGQTVSQILVDAETSMRQQKALTQSLAHIIGPKRLPMLVIDTDAVFKDPAKMGARGAGVLGLMRYGHSHAFALTPELAPDPDAVRAFLEKIDGKPFFMFGFTFMVWIHFYEHFKNLDVDLSKGILIHSGGWKKMIEKSVDPSVFRDSMKEAFGLEKIHNFYGMVEQIGSIFIEGDDGLLYPPNFSDVIIRDPVTWQPVETGKPGIIQVLSLIPKSYPGNSLLTEDLGVIESIDGGIGGWMGKGLRVLGRVPKAELRGCSDVIASQAA